MKKNTSKPRKQTGRKQTRSRSEAVSKSLSITTAAVILIAFSNLSFIFNWGGNVQIDSVRQVNIGR